MLHRSGAAAHFGRYRARYVRLPIYNVPLAPAPTLPTEFPAISKRVLVVDDNADATNTLQLLLQSLGHDTRVAYDGPSALAIADEFKPDVVLLDIGMPGMN